jgi:hypothetical protein
VSLDSYPLAEAAPPAQRPTLPSVALDLAHAANLGHRRNGLPESDYAWRRRDAAHEAAQQKRLDAVQRFRERLAEARERA